MHDTTADDCFQALLREGGFEFIHLHTADFVCRAAETRDPLLFLTVCLLSRASQSGDVCCKLDRFAGAAPGGADMPALPDSVTLRAHLRSFPVVRTPGETALLILDEKDRLYFHRAFTTESDVARALADRVGVAHTSPRGASGPGEQQWAVECSRHLPLLVLTGGPGTGKTWTIGRIVEQACADDPGCRISLAAPTGKAAMRLQQMLPLLRLPQDAPEVSVSTLHRLLGWGRASDRPKPSLNLDMLVIDECSMVDLPLFARTLRTLPASTRLVLAGDPDQLSAVGPGAVFGDVCAEDLPMLAPNRVHLRENHRFDRGPLFALADAVRRGDAETALDLLSGKEEELALHACGHHDMTELLEEILIPHWRRVLASAEPAGALAAMESLRLLSPLRQGPFGVADLNRLVAQMLAERGLLSGKRGAARDFTHDGEFFAGLPLLVTRNSYQTRLFNGDTGIILQREDGLGAWFPGSDGQVARVLPVAVLPPCEPCYASTVHKSQGSECDHVLLVLPDEPLPILTRELLYTAITRSRSRVTILGGQEILRRCLATRVRRSSGLADRIREALA